MRYNLEVLTNKFQFVNLKLAQVGKAIAPSRTKLRGGGKSELLLLENRVKMVAGNTRRP